MELSLLFIFIFNPVLGILMYALLLNNSGRQGKFIFFSIFLAFFLALVNVTKIPENDLAYHGAHYLAVKEYSILEYLRYMNFKEPIFYIWNYLLYTLSGGSLKVWVFSITFLSYVLIFISIIKFYIKLGVDNKVIVFALILFAFFPQVFSLSAHLVRQFMAGSFFIYFMVEKLFYKKTKWFILFCAIFVHSSVFILFSLIFVPFLKQKVDYKNVKFFLILLILLAAYQSLAKLGLYFISEESSLGYALARAKGNTTFMLDSFNISNYAFMLIIVFCVIKNVYFSKKNVNNLSLTHLSHICLILIFFIILNVNQVELSVRLFFYLCFFIPFFIPLLLYDNKYSVVRNFLSLAVVCFFCYRLENGTWKYADIITLLKSSIFYYSDLKEFILSI